MRVCGVVAEYNPFHRGHAYHLREARALSGCDYVAVAMSGSFVQRGEPALADKWDRAACALRCGADLVVELPARFAVRSADWFARGGVGLLAGMGADALCFGSESPLDDLLPAARLLEEEPEDVSRAIREGLDRGETLARARAEALTAQCGVSRDVLSAPNNALALEYIRANLRLSRPLELFRVPRIGAYHDAELPENGGEYASATALRLALRRGEDVSRYVPEDALSCLTDSMRLADPSRFDDLLLYALRTLPSGSLVGLCDGGEGVENRLLRAAQSAPDRESLLDAAKCKRYTRARLSRLCAQALLGLAPRPGEAPAYARVLGFRKSAAPLLRHIGDNGAIPLCSDPAALKDEPDFRMDALATDIFGLCTSDPELRTAGRDFRHPPVILL